MARTYLGTRDRKLGKVIIWTIICPTYVLFGFNNAVAGGLLDLPAWIKHFPQIDTLTTEGAQKEQNSRLQGAVVSLYTLGCFFGSLSCVFLGDRLGRRRTIILGALTNMVGAVLQSSSFSLGQLIVGRLVTGLGFGAIAATTPNWQNECAGSHHRGPVVMLIGVFVGVGLATAAWVNFGMSHVAGDAAWRFSLALPILWALPVVCFMPFLPESPRWLMKYGRVQEARQTLSALRGVDENSEQIDFVTREVEASLSIAGEAKFSDLFTNTRQRLFHRTWIAATCMMFQMIVGPNTLAFYMNLVFLEDLKLSPQTSAILSAVFFMIISISSPIGVLSIDRLGRRKLMMITTAVLGCSLAIVAGALSRQKATSTDIVAITFIYVYNFFFPIGWMGLPFLYCAEVAPLSHRVPITAISTSTTWLFAFIVALVTPVGLSNIGTFYYIIYAAINLVVVLPGVYFFFPETKGRSLEEVDAIFVASKSIFDTVRVAKDARTAGQLTVEGLARDKELNSD